MIRLDEVYKSFSNKKVLNGISFEVKSGELVTLIGKIGSGKSTIINLICGLLKPDKGHILIDNVEVSYSNRTYIKSLGLLLSGDYLIEDFSTILYWNCIGRILNLKATYIKERINYLLSLCNISDPNKPIGQLSSGNKMLVKIGTMLINSPKILIIDEPFNQLDIGEIYTIENILIDYHNLGNTIFLTTHYPEPIYRISNELILLDEGIIKEHLFINKFDSYDSFRKSLSDYFKRG